MYDMHYDLLSILYSNILGENKNMLKAINDCKEIYSSDNIRGGLINLYFMSKEEMKNELGINIDDINVVEMFKNSIKILNEFKRLGIIDNETNFLYSIEGCDYIKDEKELERLYALGLRSIILVWNNKNKYGSGNRSEEGLTNEGRIFLKRAIDLGMIIDLSHANEKTFDDMIDLIVHEQNNCKEVNVIASHSNCRSLCDRERNLTDEQLIKLRDVGGYIGLFSNRNFVSKNTDNESIEERKKSYVKHIDHVLDLGFSQDKIMLSTDDMNFSLDSSYHGLQTFNLGTIASDLNKTLLNNYHEDFVYKIMVGNAEELINKVKDNNKINKK